MIPEAESTLHHVLYQLEERLLRPEIRQSPAVLVTLLDDQFVEFGSSGQTYDKGSIIKALLSEQTVRMSISEFRSTTLAPGLALVTYRVVAHLPDGRERHSLRSSIWRFTDGSWRMIFHQGTPIVSQTS